MPGLRPQIHYGTIQYLYGTNDRHLQQHRHCPDDFHRPPDRVSRNIYHLLRDDGIYVMQDIAGSSDLENNRTHPVAPLLYTISCLHCMTVSLAQGGMGLGAMWGSNSRNRWCARPASPNSKPGNSNTTS